MFWHNSRKLLDLCHWLSPLQRTKKGQVVLNTAFFLFSPRSSEVFCDSSKNLLKENDIIKFPKLADTYERIAEEGPDVFYNGSMAQSIVDDIQAAGQSVHCPSQTCDSEGLMIKVKSLQKWLL